MNYELAKQLKDAGFPHVAPLNGEGYWKDDFFPTLEELIESVKKPITIYVDDNGSDAEQAGTEICGHGSTPTEAVARLWLALNPSK